MIILHQKRRHAGICRSITCATNIGRVIVNPDMPPGEIVAQKFVGSRIDQVGAFTGIHVERIILFTIEKIPVPALQNLRLAVVRRNTEIPAIKFLAPGSANSGLLTAGLAPARMRPFS